MVFLINNGVCILWFRGSVSKFSGNSTKDATYTLPLTVSNSVYSVTACQQNDPGNSWTLKIVSMRFSRSNVTIRYATLYSLNSDNSVYTFIGVGC